MGVLDKIEKFITNNQGTKKTPKKFLAFFERVMSQRRILFWTWISAFPMAGLSAIILDVLQAHKFEYLLGIVYVGSVSLVTLWAGVVFCPRCGKLFFNKWYFGHSLSMKCMNCGLGPRINDSAYYQKAIKVALKGWVFFLAIFVIYIGFSSFRGR